MSGGASAGSGSSVFKRSGTATTSSWRDLSPEQQNLFETGFNAVSPGGANAGVDNFLRSRIGGTTQNAPYVEELCKIIGANMPGTSIPGGANLQSMAEQNPYSGEYADNTFQRYAQDMGAAMSQARSGPVMSRGGAASRGFAEAEAANNVSLNREDVLARQRSTDAGIAQQAAGTLGGLFQDRSRTALSGIGTDQSGYFNYLQNQMGAAGMATDRVKAHNDMVPTFASLASTLQGKETNDLRGFGAQTSSSVGMGINLCCFIFLEAYHGKMPWYVRLYRDIHAPERSDRRIGYRKMAKWLVPAMQDDSLVRALVWLLMIKPLSDFGGWVFGENKHGWVYKPIKSFWFKVWEIYGNSKRK